jgi:hypothetical protein
LELPRLAVLLRAAVVLLLAGLPVLASAGPASAATGGKSNWAGYVSTGRGTRFTEVSGTWVQPAVSCTLGRSTYMSSWVGLGGDSTQTLEQIGTEADCDADGHATYSSWFELYPTASGNPKLTIRPGDVVSASVTVIGRKVRLRMVNQTLGTRFSRPLHTDEIDVSSAEWIVEAPSICLTDSDASCRDSVLSDFGSTEFTQACARTTDQAGGVTGARWTGKAYTLGTDRSAAARARGRASPSGGARAVPGALSADHDAFGVTFSAGL